MTIRLAMLGDAIAAGRGASRRTETAGARLARLLRDQGLTVTTRVFAVPGARSDSLADQVDQARRWRPDVAVVIVGANDLIHHRPAPRAAAELRDAVRRLRQLGAEVVVAPAPDLSALPDVPWTARPVLRSASMLLRDSQVIAALAEGAYVADRDHATARAFADDPSLYCEDRFHPSSPGYALIAEALMPAVSASLTARAARTVGGSSTSLGGGAPRARRTPTEHGAR